VLRSGVIGRQVLAAAASDPKAVASRTESCPAGTIRNPASGLCVKKTGVVGKKVLAAAEAAAAKAERFMITTHGWGQSSTHNARNVLRRIKKGTFPIRPFGASTTHEQAVAHHAISHLGLGWGRDGAVLTKKKAVRASKGANTRTLAVTVYGKSKRLPARFLKLVDERIKAVAHGFDDGRTRGPVKRNGRTEYEAYIKGGSHAKRFQMILSRGLKEMAESAGIKDVRVAFETF
jgi:hypothetical protein